MGGSRQNLRAWAVEFAVATAVGAFLGLIGPFGNYLNGSAEVRIAYWVGVFWIGAAVFGGGARLGHAATARWDLPVWFAPALTALVCSAIMAAVSRNVAVQVWPNLEDLPAIQWFFQVLVLSAPLVAAHAFRQHRLSPRPASVRTDEAGFWRMLPARLGREVLCLQMEDHYVRVHTQAGSELILMRLTDAVAAMGDRPGLQVHRSWWVARAAIESVEREGRNLRLKLLNGLKVPVARSAVARLKAEGLVPA